MPLDTTKYESARRSVNTDWSAKRASNEYGRFVAQQRGARNVGDQQRGWSRSWGKFAGGWGQKGHTQPGVNSGFYQKAMQQRVGDYQRDRNELRQNIGQEQHQFGLANTQLDTERDRALAQIEMEKQKAIALLAQNIQAVKPSIY